MPVTRRALARAQAEPPTAFQACVAAGTACWTQVIRNAGITAE